MEFDINKLLDYVFDNLPQKEHEQISGLLDKDSPYFNVIEELRFLKQKLGSQAAVKKYLEESKARTRKNLFEDDESD